MNRPQPLISVIVPVYNAGENLIPCLDSILGQTLGDLEIILVDDGSNDPLTLEIMDDYTAKDSRLQLIRKTNGGQSSARNAGLSEATGIYVAFVDHDDILNIHMYKTLFDAVKTGTVDVVACRFESRHADHVKKLDTDCRPEVSTLTISIEKDKNFLVDHIQIWSRLYRKSFLLDNHLEFEDLLWEEDVLFSFKVLISAGTIFFIDEVLYYHIEHGANTTHKLGRKIFHTFKAQDLILDFLKEKNCLNMFECQYRGRMFKDILFSLNAVDESYEKEFFMEAHQRIMNIPLKHYKKYYSRSKKKLLGFVQKGDFVAFKRYQAFRKKRKSMMSHLFFCFRFNRKLVMMLYGSIHGKKNIIFGRSNK